MVLRSDPRPSVPEAAMSDVVASAGPEASNLSAGVLTAPRPTDAADTLPRLAALAIMAAGLVLACINLYRSVAPHCGQALGCVDKYWADFWLIAYRDGFLRRALIGQIVDLASGGTVGWLALNIAMAAVALGAAASVPLLLWRHHRAAALAPLLFVALVSGPGVTLMGETLGDPLQVCFLIFLGYFLLAPRLSAAASLAAMAGVAVLMSMVHEASIFLFLPALWLVHALAHGGRVRLAGALVLMIALLLPYVLVLNDQGDVAPRMAVVARDGSLLTAPADALPSFGQLLREELHYYFGSLWGLGVLAYKSGSIFVFPLFWLAVLARHFGDRAAFPLFLVLLALSAPLYVIAHDWGRFCLYSFLLAVLIATRVPRDVPVIGWSPARARLERALGQAGRLALPVGLVAAFPFVYQGTDAYRVYGFAPLNYIAALLCVAVGIGYATLIRRRPA